MRLSASRGNLVIAAVIGVATVGFCGYVRAKWNAMESRGGIRALMSGHVSESGAASHDSDFKSKVPGWIPLYPGTAPESMSSSQAGIEHYVDLQMRTQDHCTKVIAWYESMLQRAGYNIYGKFEYEDPACTSMIRSDGPGFHRSIYVTTNGGKYVSIGVRAVEREVSSGAEPSIPQWIPLYPTAERPKHLDARIEETGEYHLNFSFTSTDDPVKVYSWYKAELGKLGFSATSETTPRSAGRFDSKTSDNKRALTIHNSPGLTENTFIVDVTDR